MALSSAHIVLTSRFEKIYEARFAYEDKTTWAKIQRNGMSVDNSWENAARNYVELYNWTLKTKKLS